MPRTRPPYSPEFRRQMVDLVRAGRNPDDLAREFEPSGHSIRAWVAQADRNEGRREEAAPGLIAFERDELTRLRRENKQLRLERDILSKAAALFARRVQGGLLCLAATATVRPRHGRRGLVEAHQDRACQFAADLRGSSRSCRSAWAWREAQPQADRSSDA